MNIDLFFGLVEDRYGTEFDMETKIAVMECITARDVYLNLFNDENNWDPVWWERSFRLAHTTFIPYSEYRRYNGSS